MQTKWLSGDSDFIPYATNLVITEAQQQTQFTWHHPALRTLVDSNRGWRSGV
jgi:hypothetical protein